MYDVIIIGGSYAGLAAALQLVRARRRVLVLDGGLRRNRFSSHAHGFLGHDGAPPGAIAAKGRAEVLAYPTATWLDTTVTEARSIDGGFAVRTSSGEHQARRLILATGVVDELPAISGLRERWGKTAFPCPYCDGYELELGKLGVLATGPLSIHHAILVAEWGAPGQTIFFLNEDFAPDASQLGELAAHDIRVEREPVIGVADAPNGIELRLRDGRSSELRGLFVAAHAHVAGGFAAQLGCEIENGPVSSFYKTDPTKETTVPGVFACGDAGLAFSAVSFAVADGVRAGVSAHQSLIFRPT